VKGQDIIKLVILTMIIVGTFMRILFDINLIDVSILDFLTISKGS